MDIIKALTKDPFKKLLALFKKRSEVRDLKAEENHWKVYRWKFRFKRIYVKIERKAISSLEETEILKWKASIIKAKMVKAECAILRRELAKHATRKRFYVIAITILWIVVAIMLTFYTELCHMWSVFRYWFWLKNK